MKALFQLSIQRYPDLCYLSDSATLAEAVFGSPISNPVERICG